MPLEVCVFNLSVDFYLPARGLPESLRPLVTEMQVMICVA